MKHLQLIRLARQLGYKSITNEGFSVMWVQAVCVGVYFQ